MCQKPLLEDVEQTFGPGCCRSGLKALPDKHKKLIKPEKPRCVLGSVYIENCMKEKDKNRKLSQTPSYWDYLIGYRPDDRDIPRAYFVEVHPAAKNEHLEEMQNKLEWLIKHLEGSPFLSDRWKCSYHWIVPSGEISFHHKFALRATKGTIQIQFQGRGPLTLK